MADDDIYTDGGQRISAVRIVDVAGAAVAQPVLDSSGRIPTIPAFGRVGKTTAAITTPGTPTVLGTNVSGELQFSVAELPTGGWIRLLNAVILFAGSGMSIPTTQLLLYEDPSPLAFTKGAIADWNGVDPTFAQKLVKSLGFSQGAGGNNQFIGLASAAERPPIKIDSNGKFYGVLVASSAGTLPAATTIGMRIAYEIEK